MSPHLEEGFYLDGAVNLDIPQRGPWSDFEQKWPKPLEILQDSKLPNGGFQIREIQGLHLDEHGRAIQKKKPSSG